MPGAETIDPAEGAQRAAAAVLLRRAAARLEEIRRERRRAAAASFVAWRGRHARRGAEELARLDRAALGLGEALTEAAHGVDTAVGPDPVQP